MQKTIHFALFLFIVTGLLFTSCGNPEIAPEDAESSLEESLHIDSTLPSDEEDTSSDQVDQNSQQEQGSQDEQTTETSAYTDGSYSVTESYTSPGGKDEVGVTLVLKSDVVTSVSITNGANDPTSKQFQTLFADGISAVVVGKPIDQLGSISAVNGASLTTGAFKNAVKDIMSQAQGA